MKAIAYYRVSTAAQGRSGLGLDAQRRAVEDLARERGLAVLAHFTEVESGRKSDRPQLLAALRHAKFSGSVLVIAKLDRLSRNAAFLLRLRDSGARFIAADLPDANDLTIGVLAVVAQAEREAISRRTSDALTAIKFRLRSNGGYTSTRSGRPVVRLGNPNGISPIRRAGKGNVSAIAAVKALAGQRAAEIAELSQTLFDGVPPSASALSRALNANGILSPRGGRWYPSSVRSVMRRLSRLGESSD